MGVVEIAEAMAVLAGVGKARVAGEKARVVAGWVVDGGVAVGWAARGGPGTGEAAVDRGVGVGGRAAEERERVAVAKVTAEEAPAEVEMDWAGAEKGKEGVEKGSG